MLRSSKVVLQKKTRYADSILYQIQKDFFEREGVKAWLGHVPYYITSNPMIANMYTHVFMGLAQDLFAQGKYDNSQPIYLVEIGTGCGRFSFYMMQRLLELQEILNLQAVKFKYIMTDFTGTNLDFWRSHPQIQPLLEKGIVDFAIYDAERSSEIHLVHENKTLTKGSVKNPIITFCNYLFDAVPYHAFHIDDNGELHEAMLRITTPSKNLKKKKPVDIKKLDISFDYFKTNADTHYDDPVLNDILKYYQKTFKRASTILIPHAGLHCMNMLRELSNGQLMLLASDKGYSHLFELEGLNDPRIKLDQECFFMMVNFHAVGKYFEGCGGESVIPSPRRGIKTGVFTTGLPKLESLPQTALAIDTHVEKFNIADFFNMHEHMKKSRDDVELRILGSHMNFCRWDPHIFHFFCKRIGEEIATADEALLHLFTQGLKRIMENFYFMPNNQNIPFEVALIFHALKDYRQALDNYKLSIKHFGKDFSLLYNTGLCHYLVDEFEEALAIFQEAYTLNPMSEEAKDWVERIKQELDVQ